MTKVKSDGGSSSYYELQVPDYIIASIIRQIDQNKPTVTIETGDVIRMLVDNDFDAGNIMKALRRIIMAKKGEGKEGTDIDYDLNKIDYHTKEIRRTQ